MASEDKNFSAPFEVPEQMREFADKSFDQARRAFDSFMAATQSTVTTVEGSANVMQSGTMDISKTVLSFAETNVESAFNFAQKLLQAKDLQEVVSLQQEFLKTQMETLGTQAKTMSEQVMKTASDAAKRTDD